MPIPLANKEVAHPGAYRWPANHFRRRFSRSGGLSSSGQNNVPTDGDAFFFAYSHRHWTDIPASSVVMLDDFDMSMSYMGKNDLFSWKTLYGFMGYLSFA